MTNHKRFRALALIAKASTILSAFFCLALIGNLSPVAGQQPEPRPVARLIGGRASDNDSSRSRILSEGKNADDAKSVVTFPSVDETNEIERRAFDATNLVRAKHGLPSLVWDQSLYRMACAHSRQMAVNGFFSHQAPGGLGLRDRARVFGIRSFKVLAENIAYNQGYDDPGAFAVERWMISSLHRANILSNEFQAVAIGSFIGPDQQVYLTQVFISR